MKHQTSWPSGNILDRLSAVKYFADWSFTTAQIAFYSCIFWFYNRTFCHNCTLTICPATSQHVKTSYNLLYDLLRNKIHNKSNQWSLGWCRLCRQTWRRVPTQLIPRSPHTCCPSLALCLQWYNGLIAPRVHSSLIKRTNTTDRRRPWNKCRLNRCLECISSFSSHLSHCRQCFSIRLYQV